jgi:acyl carrier protein
MSVIDEVKQVISESLRIPVDQLKDSSRLVDFGAESIDVIELLFDLEEKFDIEIAVRANRDNPKAAGDNGKLDEIAFMPVGDIAGIVNKLVAAKHA